MLAKTNTAFMVEMLDSTFAVLENNDYYQGA